MKHVVNQGWMAALLVLALSSGCAGWPTPWGRGAAGDAPDLHTDGYANQHVDADQYGRPPHPVYGANAPYDANGYDALANAESPEKEHWWDGVTSWFKPRTEEQEDAPLSIAEQRRQLGYRNASAYAAETSGGQEPAPLRDENDILRAFSQAAGDQASLQTPESGQAAPMPGQAAPMPGQSPAVQNVEEQAQLDSQLALARFCEMRDTPQAETLYRAYLEAHPGCENVLPYHRLGVVCAKQQKFEEADQFFAKAMAMSPNNPELLVDIGYFFYLQHRLDDAERVLTMARSLAPGDQRTIEQLALVLGVQGRYADSLALFRQTLSEGEAYSNLAYIYLMTGDIQKAKEVYSYALAIDGSLRRTAEAAVVVAQKEEHIRRVAENPAGMQSAGPPRIANQGAVDQMLAASHAMPNTSEATPGAPDAPDAVFQPPQYPSTGGAVPAPNAWAQPSAVASPVNPPVANAHPSPDVQGQPTMPTTELPAAESTQAQTPPTAWDWETAQAATSPEPSQVARQVAPSSEDVWEDEASEEDDSDAGFARVALRPQATSPTPSAMDAEVIAPSPSESAAPPQTMESPVEASQAATAPAEDLSAQGDASSSPFARTPSPSAQEVVAQVPTSGTDTAIAQETPSYSVEQEAVAGNAPSPATVATDAANGVESATDIHVAQTSQASPSAPAVQDTASPEAVVPVATPDITGFACEPVTTETNAVATEATENADTSMSVAETPESSDEQADPMRVAAAPSPTVSVVAGASSDAEVESSSESLLAPSLPRYSWRAAVTTATE